MSDKIQCNTHGECFKTYICTHLTGEAAGLGFNYSESDDNPFPDAWCDNCEIIRAAHDGWNEESEKLTKIVLLCSGCYERARIRNTRPSVTLDDLADLRWKCGHCDVWHSGPCLDFGYDEPHHWTKEHGEASRKHKLLPGWSKKRNSTFLTEDYCAIDDEYFFVRGLIHLPIIGAAETLRWGVWGSLSRDNFNKLREQEDSQSRTELPAMFSWLSNKIPEYPDTLNLKMYAHIQEPGTRPFFFLQATEHPLSREYHKGIAPERVREIMLGRLQENE
ncbi:MAG TPA: DUF2199 domain-containing protein [Candidatus Angelobacter sp.]|nr:DUF2199 domain-containing protein [Candidatus Angelobacter sp.]